MSPEGSQEKVSAYGLIPVCRGVFIHHFKINLPHFLLPSLFWKLSQPLGQDKQNSKQIYCQLPIIIFIWTCKGFISPESFLNFLVNLCISPWLQRFQIYSIKTTANTFVNQKIESVQLYSCPQAKLSQVFIIIPQAEGNCSFFPNSIFWRYFFQSRKMEGGGLCSWKITKINKGIGLKFW